MNTAAAEILEELRKEIESLYGFNKELGEPNINLGPCAPFAKAFYDAWNSRFDQKIHICFVMDRDNNECWHTLVRLPDGLLYDGGVGIHSDLSYKKPRFEIEDMINYDAALLEERAFGLDRSYPRYCPNFDLETVKAIIAKHLDRIANH